MHMIGWLHALALFSGFYPPAALLFGLGQGSDLLFVITGSLLLLPIALSWTAIKKIRRLSLYLLTGLALSLGYGWLMRHVWSLSGTNPYQSFFLSFGLSSLLFMIRGYGRIKKGRIQKMLREMSSSCPEQTDCQDMEIPDFLDTPHPLQWILFALSYIAGALLKSSFYWRTIFCLFLADVFLCFAFQFMDGFYSFLKAHSRTANLPVKTMTRIVRIIFGMACAVLLLFILPSLLYGKEPLSNITFKPLEPLPIEQEFPEAMTPDSRYMAPEDFPDQEEMREPPKWLVFLSNLFMYLVSAAVIVAVLAAIYRACQNAGKFFASETEDEIQFLSKGFTDQNLLHQKSSLSSSKDMSASKKIRKYYKKSIQRGIKGAVPDSHTPAQLEKCAGFPDSGEYHYLHECYEKARYSQKGCTPEDAALLLHGKKPSPP